MSTPLVAAVVAAINEVRVTFHPANVIVDPDGQGGARVIVERAPLGPPYGEECTWIGAHLPAQLPYSDIYPVFVRGDLRRLDAKPLCAPLSTGHTFMARAAVQVSRRSNRVDLSVQTPAMKLQKVLHFLRSET